MSEVWKRIVKRSDEALIHGLPKIRESVQDSTETPIGNCNFRSMPLYGNNCHGEV
jgi:phage baseplate assembly protein W